MSTTKPSVVVLGAGVIGLTSAVLLAEAGYKVTIIAAQVPGDESIEYTSPWAGAHWRTHATRDEPELCDWDVQTYRYWTDLLEREARDSKLPKSGIKMQDSYHFWDNAITEDLWWAPHVRDFRQLSLFKDPVATINHNRPSDAPEVIWAAASLAPSINVPQYLLYLQERARASGAVVFQSRLPTDGGFDKALSTAEGIHYALGRGKQVDVFVNATGMGARQLCGDQKMYPIRGQTVLVKGEAAATRTRYHGGAIGSGTSSYCIPRPGSGTTILGGTKEKGSWDSSANPETTATILERCSWMVPELLTGNDGGFEVISTQAGLRPAREGGPRMEREATREGRRVVHMYGHAGGGYQNSIGAARKVVKMVEESVGQQGMVSKL